MDPGSELSTSATHFTSPKPARAANANAKGLSSGAKRERPMSEPDPESQAARKYPRKRAVAACQFCRTRRIKCNNERPSCSSCAAIGTQCNYSYQTDHSSFDPASLVILEKLDKILVRLDGNPIMNIEHAGFRSALTPNSQQGPSSCDSLPLASLEEDGPSPRIQIPDVSAFEYLKIPSGRTSADSILTWPIFGDRFTPEYLTNELLAATVLSDNGLADDGNAIRPSGYGMINDQDVPFLLDRFLTLVHVKNPFLDAGLLKKYGRRMAEDGLQWDAPTCLVLLACALGAMALPFEFEVKTRMTIDEQLPPRTLNRESKQTAELYYQSALKRFGLLRCSMIKSQCHMLSAIYLMYSLQPTRAWNDFLQASSNYFMYSRAQMACKLRRTDHIMSENSESRRLEQSLYWTCFKSECEMREEISLPESGLSELHYPYMFPSPPRSGTPETTDHAFISNITGNWGAAALDNPSQDSVLDAGNQQSWLYYMTEIALRRIGNRVLNAFYHSNHTYWATFNIHQSHEIAQLFEVQLDEWKENLPESLRFNVELGPVDELRCMTHGRYLCIKFWLYRPFLYHVIHSQPTDRLSLNLSQAYARKALAFCTDGNVEYPTSHRHHGTWYVCRLLAAKAFMILATKKSGKLELPDRWTTAIEEILEMLRYWETESPDVKKAREVIETLYAEVENES